MYIFASFYCHSAPYSCELASLVFARNSAPYSLRSVFREITSFFHETLRFARTPLASLAPYSLRSAFAPLRSQLRSVFVRTRFARIRTKLRSVLAPLRVLKNRYALFQNTTLRSKLRSVSCSEKSLRSFSEHYTSLRNAVVPSRLLMHEHGHVENSFNMTFNIILLFVEMPSIVVGHLFPNE